MGVSKNRGTPKSSILIGFSIINHPFWGTPVFGNTYIDVPPFPRVHFQFPLAVSLRGLSKALGFTTVPSLTHPGDQPLLSEPWISCAPWNHKEVIHGRVFRSWNIHHFPVKIPGEIAWFMIFGSEEVGFFLMMFIVVRSWRCRNQSQNASGCKWNASFAISWKQFSRMPQWIAEIRF